MKKLWIHTFCLSVGCSPALAMPPKVNLQAQINQNQTHIHVQETNIQIGQGGVCYDEELDFSKEKWAWSDIREHFLVKCPFVKKLNLSGKAIGEEGAQWLAQQSSGLLKYLEVLTLDHPGLNDATALFLIEGAFPSLKSLSLSGDNLQTQTILALLGKPFTVTFGDWKDVITPCLHRSDPSHITLAGQNSLGNPSGTSLKLLMTLLSKVPVIRSLDLSGNGIGDEGAQWLSQGENFQYLWTLNLQGNSISNKGVKYLAEGCLQGRFRNLGRLDLSNNKIGDDGCPWLAEAFSKGAVGDQPQLDLRGNPLSDKGCRLWAEGFQKALPYEERPELFISSNIGIKGLLPLAQGQNQEKFQVYVQRNHDTQEYILGLKGLPWLWYFFFHTSRYFDNDHIVNVGLPCGDDVIEVLSLVPWKKVYNLQKVWLNLACPEGTDPKKVRSLLEMIPQKIGARVQFQLRKDLPEEDLFHIFQAIPHFRGICIYSNSSDYYGYYEGSNVYRFETFLTFSIGTIEPQQIGGKIPISLYSAGGLKKFEKVAWKKALEPLTHYHGIDPTLSWIVNKCQSMDGFESLPQVWGLQSLTFFDGSIRPEAYKYLGQIQDLKNLTLPVCGDASHQHGSRLQNFKELITHLPPAVKVSFQPCEKGEVFLYSDFYNLCEAYRQGSTEVHTHYHDCFEVFSEVKWPSLQKLRMSGSARLQLLLDGITKGNLPALHTVDLTQAKTTPEIRREFRRYVKTVIVRENEEDHCIKCEIF